MTTILRKLLPTREVAGMGRTIPRRLWMHYEPAEQTRFRLHARSLSGELTGNSTVWKTGRRCTPLI